MWDTMHPQGKEGVSLVLLFRSLWQLQLQQLPGPLHCLQDEGSSGAEAHETLEFQFMVRESLEVIWKISVCRMGILWLHYWFAISRDSRENIGLGPFPRNEKIEMPFQAGLSGLRILFR
ncbi:hypothetical protein Taro_033392 [Colocasia esculenta]|uniref:Uncharacterized protein n=1 Tax=Colocasia esculenta TaxID=4460 RepID=A0A843W004_COLES|nr:hypothetical protein [Colocasia esculenta]